MSVANFVCNTSGATQNIPHNGPGTPKLAIILISGATALDTNTATARMSSGMTDGTNQLCHCTHAEDGASANVNDTGYRVDNASIIRTIIANSATEALDSVATWTGWDATNVTINWSDFPATAVRGIMLTFFGDGLEVLVSKITGSASIGGTATVDTTFIPDFAIASSAYVDIVASTSGTSHRMAFGLASAPQSAHSGIQQGCITSFYNDRSSPSTCSGTTRDNRIAVRTLEAGGGESLEVTDFAPFTVTTRDAASSATALVALMRLGGNKSTVLVPQIDSNATGNKNLTGFGFKPKAVIFLANSINAVNTHQAIEAVGDISLGGTDGTNTASIGLAVEDAQLTGNTACNISGTQLAQVPNDAGAFDWQATFVAFDTDGLTINVGDASSTGDDYCVIGAIGEKHPNSQFLRPFRERHRQQLARM